jgi:hypothetical protein
MHSQKINETRVRRLARRCGFHIRKSRQSKHVPNLDNRGDYMVLDSRLNIPVLGFRFDATLDDIANYFDDAA